MVKSVLGVYHQGLRDWILQRASALVMAVYFIGFIAYLVWHPGLSFAEWHSLFSQSWMKVASTLFLVAIVFHAWVGMWTIFTDYIKPYVIRSFFHLLVFLMLAACLIWGLLILWSV